MIYTGNMANIIIKGVPDEIYKRFKANCVLQGISVKDKLIELIKREAVKK